MVPLVCASLLLALFVATKLFGGQSFDRIKARTVGHSSRGDANRDKIKKRHPLYGGCRYLLLQKNLQ